LLKFSCIRVCIADFSPLWRAAHLDAGDMLSF
jgi:hypothetical protein